MQATRQQIDAIAKLAQGYSETAQFQLTDAAIFMLAKLPANHVIVNVSEANKRLGIFAYAPNGAQSFASNLA